MMRPDQCEPIIADIAGTFGVDVSDVGSIIDLDILAHHLALRDRAREVADDLKPPATKEDRRLVAAQHAQHCRHVKDDGLARRAPRLVTEALAANRVGLALSVFRHRVGAGRSPGPLLDTDLYDVRALDAALDKLSGLNRPSNALDAWRLQKGSKRAG